MGAAAYIAKNFLNKEICICLGDDAEMLTYQEAWTANREYFRGVIVEVDEGIVALEIEGSGIIYLSDDSIRCFWSPSFDYYKSIRTSVTKRPVGARR